MLVVADGLGDRPVPTLGGKTPLEAAQTEHLDALSLTGMSGLLDPIAPGVRPGSDTSHLALLGYDPHVHYAGRGPIEALGVGLDLHPGDVALRCNFATVDRDLRVTDRRAGRIREGTSELAKSIDGLQNGGVTFRFKEGTEHRGVLVLRGDGLSAQVGDTDPHGEAPVLSAKARDATPASRRTADALDWFTSESHRILDAHTVNIARDAQRLPKANVVLARGAGLVRPVPSMAEHHHVRSAGVAGVGLIRGVIRLVGMDLIDVPGATGGADSDYMAKARAVVAAAADHDFVLVNFKGPDIAGHDGDPAAKVKAIERIDAAVGHIRANFPGILAVTADHSTPVTLRDHSADPVPLVINGPGTRRDGVPSYDETHCARGCLGRLLGMHLMPLLLDLTDRTEKFGA